MFRPITCSLCCCLLINSVVAAADFPNSSAPEVGIATIGSDRSLNLGRKVMELRERMVTKMVTKSVVVDGKEEIRKEPVAVTEVVTSYKPIYTTVTSDDFRVFDVAGKRIPAESYGRVLKEPTVVLYSDQGKLLDSFFADLYRKDLLIIYLRPNALRATTRELPGPSPSPTPPSNRPSK